MNKVGKENAERDSNTVAIAPESTNGRSGLYGRTAASTISVQKIAARAMFLDSDDEYDDDSKVEDLVSQRLALQQKATRLSNPSKRHSESLSLHSDLFDTRTKPQESGRTSLLERTDALSREQAQLHRLIGDYMLTAKGDYIMDQMEEALRDDQFDNSKFDRRPEHQPPPQPTSQPTEIHGFDLSDILQSMEDFEKYIAEN